MRYHPKTEAELQAESLLPAGDYPFEVIEAQEGKSAKGNDMITVKLNVFDGDGRGHHVYDYLLEAMAFKLRHFCQATGMKYEVGELSADDCVGKTGRVTIRIKDASGNFKAKNEAKDYVVSVATISTTQSTPKNTKDDASEIPF